jgi:hypothetical protein
MPRPSEHPEPPPEISALPLPILTDQSGWCRLHRADRHPVFFGRTGDSRFDAPAGEYGVLYLGDSPHCAFAETYGRLDQARFPIVTRQHLSKRHLAYIVFQRALRLVDLTGAGLARIRADNRLCVGDYRIAQRWSQAFWNHPEQPDGLCYRSRHDPSRLCLALFDRASNAVMATDRGSLGDSSNEGLLAEILDGYGFGLID